MRGPIKLIHSRRSVKSPNFSRWSSTAPVLRGKGEAAPAVEGRGLATTVRRRLLGVPLPRRGRGRTAPGASASPGCTPALTRWSSSCSGSCPVTAGVILTTLCSLMLPSGEPGIRRLKWGIIRSSLKVATRSPEGGSSSGPFLVQERSGSKTTSVRRLPRDHRPSAQVRRFHLRGGLAQGAFYSSRWFDPSWAR